MTSKAAFHLLHLARALGWRGELPVLIDEGFMPESTLVVIGAARDFVVQKLSEGEPENGN